MKLKPNWPMYESVDQNGFLFIYLAMQDDVCIGYSMNIIMHHFHYADLRVAQNDVLFVKKEFRGGRLGLRLLKVKFDPTELLKVKSLAISSSTYAFARILVTKL